MPVNVGLARRPLLADNLPAKVQSAFFKVVYDTVYGEAGETSMSRSRLNSSSTRERTHTNRAWQAWVVDHVIVGLLTWLIDTTLNTYAV